MTIYEKIENKGILDAEQIISNGLAKADSVQVAAIEAATVQLQATFAKTTEKNEHQLKTKTTEFEQSAKQEILTSKKALIEEVLNLALIKMKQLSDVQWKTLVIQTLSGDELNGNETIVASSADQKRFLALFTTDQTAKYPVKLDLLNKALSGKDFSLTLSKKVSPVDGGFFVDGADFDIDHSYVTILSTLRDRYESELASILFDGRN
jgi:vacuolar-type H+-ATPase subunit E/Vma4